MAASAYLSMAHGSLELGAWKESGLYVGATHAQRFSCRNPLRARVRGVIVSLVSTALAKGDWGHMAYVAIGTDGTRPVVWGLGDTYESALADAAGQEDSDADRAVEVSEEIAAAVRAGEVSCEALGID